MAADSTQNYLNIYKALGSAILFFESTKQETTLAQSLSAAEQVLQGTQYTKNPKLPLVDQAKLALQALYQNANSEIIESIQQGEISSQAPEPPSIQPPPPPIPIAPVSKPPTTEPPSSSHIGPVPDGRPLYGTRRTVGKLTVRTTRFAEKLMPGLPGQIAGQVTRIVSGRPKDVALGLGSLGALAFGGPLGAGIFLVAFSSRFRRNLLKNLRNTLAFFAAWTFASIAMLTLLTASVLFIINSGAYIVPPGESLLELVNLQKGESTLADGEITPADACFNYVGAWPKSYVAFMNQAIQTMTQTGPYLEKICNKGEVNLTWGNLPPDCPADRSKWFISGSQCYGGEVTAINNMIIYAPGTYSYGSAIYTLSHESGHIFARRYPTIQNSLYRDNASVSAERPVCTYPIEAFRGTLGEDFAEMIALYIVNNPSLGGRAATDNLSCIAPNFKASYPQHWQFARDHLFESSLGW